MNSVPCPELSSNLSSPRQSLKKQRLSKTSGSLSFLRQSQRNLRLAKMLSAIEWNPGSCRLSGCLLLAIPSPLPSSAIAPKGITESDISSRHTYTWSAGNARVTTRATWATRGQREGETGDTGKMGGQRDVGNNAGDARVKRVTLAKWTWRVRLAMWQGGRCARSGRNADDAAKWVTRGSGKTCKSEVGDTGHMRKVGEVVRRKE
ncbi:uncharacterized protein BXZ73DRAFT_78648 [Epithele typhae]|uniref:uncharacterized protein n=1 Tax=Epithele typhae TaxID=378194 RepID=UPI002007324D|nr:uncharacterized protein BXZ73DRAFT_78648 [Epithele typhae]KAH9926538.1 hypothetical protein BXZ73DRAFT_78648 [Epithele typhae]